MTQKNDSLRTRKALIKKLEDMLITAKEVLYTCDFDDDNINFEVKRQERKVGYSLRIDVSPFRSIKRKKDSDGIETV